MTERARDTTDIIESGLKLFGEFKSLNRTIPVIGADGAGAGRLEPVRVTDENVRLLTEWRDRFKDAFPTQFRVTEEGTRRWLEKQVLDMPGRILFMVKAAGGMAIGHMGYANLGGDRFGFTKLSAEIDNVVRGRSGEAPGMMAMAIRALLEWGFSTLCVRAIYLRVFSDNGHAVRFYERCGFEVVRDIPLKREADGRMVRFIEIPEGGDGRPDRFFRLMAIHRGQG